MKNLWKGIAILAIWFAVFKICIIYPLALGITLVAATFSTWLITSAK